MFPLHIYDIGIHKYMIEYIHANLHSCISVYQYNSSNEILHVLVIRDKLGNLE